MTSPDVRQVAPRPNAVGEASWKLIRKDLYVFRPRYRIFVMGAFFLAALQTFLHEEAFFWIGVILACVLTMVVPALEWLQESDRMLSSLPIGRSTIVRARYVWAVSACGLSIVLWSLTGRLLAPVIAPQQAVPGMWVGLEGWLTFLMVAGAFVAFLLPLCFRLGFGWGAVVFSVLAGSAMMGAAALPSALNPATSLLDTQGPVRWIQPPSLPVRSAVSFLVAEVGLVWGAMLVLLALAGMFVLSAWISTRGFEARDL